MRRERELALDCRENRVVCARERDEERVPLRVDLVPAVGFERRAQKPLMVGEHAP
jgi:hypothetical protein